MMNNWMELIILLLFLILSAAGSASSSKKKRARPSPKPLDETPKPPQQASPPWPASQADSQKSAAEKRPGDSSVWSKSGETRQTWAEYREPLEAPARQNEYGKDRRDLENKRRRLDPTYDPEVEDHETIRLDEVFREMFDLEEPEEPQKPQQEAKPAAHTEPKRETPLWKKSARQEKSLLHQSQPSSSKRPAQPAKKAEPVPVFQRLAQEAQQNPIKAAVMYSEIFGHPRSVRRYPRPKRVGQF